MECEVRPDTQLSASGGESYQIGEMIEKEIFSTKSIPKRVNVCPGKVFSYILYVFKIKKKPRGKTVERFLSLY